MTTSSTFETALYHARQSGDESHLAQVFADTEFFVGILQEPEQQAGADFRFAVYNGQNGEHVVMVSEDISRLAGGGGQLAAKMYGRELIPLLHPQLGIVVALEEGGFGMPAPLLAQWRKALQQA